MPWSASLPAKGRESRPDPSRQEHDHDDTASSPATSAAGRKVRYLGGFFLPAAARAICVFDADTAADVTAVNTLAGVPATDIIEAIDLRAATRQPPDQADGSGTSPNRP